MSNQVHPFLKAVQLVGGATLAQALGVSPQLVSKMRKLAESDPSYLVPSNHLRAIERATAGRVTIAELVIDPSGRVKVHDPESA